VCGTVYKGYTVVVDKRRSRSGTGREAGTEAGSSRRSADLGGQAVALKCIALRNNKAWRSKKKKSNNNKARRGTTKETTNPKSAAGDDYGEAPRRQGSGIDDSGVEFGVESGVESGVDSGGESGRDGRGGARARISQTVLREGVS
jgi:hypothetical protein